MIEVDVKLAVGACWWNELWEVRARVRAGGASGGWDQSSASFSDIRCHCGPHHEALPDCRKLTELFQEKQFKIIKF